MIEIHFWEDHRLLKYSHIIEQKDACSSSRIIKKGKMKAIVRLMNTNLAYSHLSIKQADLLSE